MGKTISWTLGLTFIVIIFIGLQIDIVQAKWTHKYPEHMISHKVCGKDSRLNKNYCLEIIEFKYQSSRPKKGAALLISGFFQNVHIWDLLPQDDISVAKHMMENYGIQPYVLHVRGIGNSDYIYDTNLDDIAIDDIPMALKYITEKEQSKIILMGHSQGAITSLASMSGISRCGEKNNCFKKDIALKRQQSVKTLGLLAGNAAMTIENKDNFLLTLAPLGWNSKIQSILRWLDEIDIKLASYLTGPLAMIGYWDNLYNLENVSAKSRKALWTKTVDTTTGNITIQFADAIKQKDILSVGNHSYSNHAKWVKLPVVQQTYEDDQLAEPLPTRDDTFAKIGSSNKLFDMAPSSAHEDFFMEKHLHRLIDPVLEFVTTN